MDNTYRLLEDAQTRCLFCSTTYRAGYYTRAKGAPPSAMTWHDDGSVAALIEKGWLQIDSKYIPAFADIDRLVLLTPAGQTALDSL